MQIEAQGSPEALASFTADLAAHPPALAQVDSFEVSILPDREFASFEIIESADSQEEFLPVSVDLATCPDCLRELLDPHDRRYRYPFINCTHCGPRFSILRQIPYDRPNTTMAAFTLCPDCEREYDNPEDRRFHAQPVACPVCGPKIWFEAHGERLAERENALRMAEEWLQSGKVLAIKGLGGFHLACDALNPVAVENLRQRKRRSAKPFALMAGSLEIISKYCELSPFARQMLVSPQAPIMLLPLNQAGQTLAASVAPGQKTLGFMLPYTPLHHLIFKDLPEAVLVMTSANLSEEPIAYTNEDAISRLNGLADAFLMHDRPIVMRVDDSVLTELDGQPYFFRHARGYAPNPIRLPFAFQQEVLACGTELKNTFTLGREAYAFISHYIGDLENMETLRSFEEGIRHYEALFRVHPKLIACDLHPDYLATRYAQERAASANLPLVAVQHHHAHIASCLAENSWAANEPVIGLAFDGTGYGPDGSIWGGEVLIANYSGYERSFYLKPIRLPGGDAAIRTPARSAQAWLDASGQSWQENLHLPPIEYLGSEAAQVIQNQLKTGFNAPFTSSMGRLFDAVSALLGVCQQASYEGQAAIELEALADPAETGFYPIPVDGQLIDPGAMFFALLEDRSRGTPLPVLSARFHNSLAQLCLRLCEALKASQGLNTVAFSGGVWQNTYLLRRSKAALEKAGFRLLIHRQLPPNDGCVSLGQAVVAHWQTLNKE